MNTDFWLERWSTGQIGFHQSTVNPHLLNYWHEYVYGPSTTIFVPLCGKSDDLLWLQAQGHKVIGIELSQIAIEAFFEENKIASKNVTRHQTPTKSYYQFQDISLICGDFFALDTTDLTGVNAIYDRAALIALPPDMRKSYADHLLSALKTPVPIFLITMEYNQPSSAPPFSVDQQEVQSLFGSHYEITLLRSVNLLESDERERWLSRGVTEIYEHVFHLAPRSS